jgi:selenocysteine lyase/cysteine desulfurase
MASKETFESLVRSEFTPSTTYLNTASRGVPPARTVRALRASLEAAADGRPDDMFTDVEACRASFARLAGVPVSRVAVGSSVAVFGGLIAASLPAGAEVLTADGDFSSMVNPFHVRDDLKVRSVPLERIAESVRPDTALVAVSSVQSADGRIADLGALRAAAGAHGSHTYLDVSQSVGWLPLEAGDWDYVVSVTYKWLCGLKGGAFLVVPEDLGGLTPVFAGWVAGEDPWASNYGPVTELAQSARRFDQSPALPAYTGTRHALELIEELGVDAVQAHDLALAGRFLDGLRRLGHEPVPAPGSAIVSVPRLGYRATELHAAGIHVSDRAGNLRAAFHLHNTTEDVDRLLDVLSG